MSPTQIFAMMAKSESLVQSTILEDFSAQLTCAVCLDHYNNPKTLPCLHSFCLECIRDLPPDDDCCISCPTCRTKHPLPDRGANEFTSSFQISSLVSTLHTHLSKNESSSPDEEHQVNDNIRCKQHNNSLELYCETCGVYICHDCTTGNEHKKHRIYDQNQMVKCYTEYHQQIEGELKQFKNRISDIDAAIVNLTNRETAVQEQGEEVTTEIHQHAQQLIDIIHESERQLIQQVDTITQHKKEFLAKQKKAAEGVYSQLKTCEELIERNLREMSQEKVITEKQAMIEQMKKASEHSDPAMYVPIEQANVKYKKYSCFEQREDIGGIIEGSMCAKVIVNSPNRFFPHGKKCLLSLTLQSHDGSPFPVPCSAISCVAHYLTGTIKDVECSISKGWSAGKYTISFVPQSNKIQELEVLVGGAGIPPDHVMKCDFQYSHSKSINLDSKHYQVVVCDNGDILATAMNDHSITVLDKEGRKVRSIGTKGMKEGQFTCPNGLAVTNDGHILVTDYYQLQKLTFDGVCVESVRSSVWGIRSDQPQFNGPRGIAVHPTTGQIFVADQYKNCVQVLNADLTFSHIITLQDDQQFRQPFYVSLDSEGYLYVAEYGNHCITKLTTTGQYITRFGSKGSAPGQLSYPSSLAINGNLVYVCDSGNHCVSIFDTNGRFHHCIGNFDGNWGVAVDKQYSLYVSDIDNKRIIVY